MLQILMCTLQKILSKSTSDSIPTSLQRKKTIQYEHSIPVDTKKCRSLSAMSLKKSRSVPRPSPSPEEDPNWMDVISFTKLNLTPQELQDTMKQMLMLENDPKSVTRSIVANALEQVNVNTDKVSNMISNENLSSFQEEVSILNITIACDGVLICYSLQACVMPLLASWTTPATLSRKKVPNAKTL